MRYGFNSLAVPALAATLATGCAGLTPTNQTTYVAANPNPEVAVSRCEDNGIQVVDGRSAINRANATKSMYQYYGRYNIKPQVEEVITAEGPFIMFYTLNTPNIPNNQGYGYGYGNGIYRDNRGRVADPITQGIMGVIGNTIGNVTGWAGNQLDKPFRAATLKELAACRSDLQAIHGGQHNQQQQLQGGAAYPNPAMQQNRFYQLERR